MEIRFRLFLVAFLITGFLLVTILLVNSQFDVTREEIVDKGMQEVVGSLTDIQTLLLLGDVYGERMLCLIFNEKLKKLDTSLWDLGIKIDQYRQATEEFMESPYYKTQKRRFNEQEVLYLGLLKTSKQKCGFKTPIILFFYKNSADCKKCDDQSFVLSDINRKIDNEVAIFSFDKDLNLTTINLLDEYYAIDEYPCVVIEENRTCGMQDKDAILRKLCAAENISVCPGMS